MQANIVEGIILATPKTLEERESYATQAVDYLHIGFPTVIDTMDDRTEQLYDAWPTRHYLVAIDGTLAFVGGPGPRGFSPPEFETALRRYLGLDGTTNVSAASYEATLAAPGSIAAAFGTNWTPTPEAVTSTDLPYTLGGVSVTVTDSQGAERPAPLYAVSAQQINYVIPPEAALGPAVVTVTAADQNEYRGPLLLKGAAPGLFSADATGQGLAAAHAVHVAGDDTQTWTPVAEWDAAQGKFAANPIRFGAGDEAVALVLYGTGIRGAEQLSVEIGGIPAPLLWYGPQPEFPGLDQVNVLLPRELGGRGRVPVLLTADGVSANFVEIRME